MKLFKPYDYIDKVEKLLLVNELKGEEMFSGIFEEKIVSVCDGHFVANIPLAYHRVNCTKSMSHSMIEQFNNINTSGYKVGVKTGYDEFGNVIITADDIQVFLDNKYYKLFEKDIDTIYVKSSKDIVYLFNREYIIGAILPIVKR